MLIHVTPRFYQPSESRFNFEKVRLLSVTIVELGIELSEPELAVGQPYPNKDFWVGSRKLGRKAIEGLLFEAPEQVNSYRVDSRWCINDQHIVAHIVEHQVLDQEFDAVTDKMLLWNAFHGHPHHAANRFPEGVGAPAVWQPKAELFYRKEHVSPTAIDEVHRGLIQRRTETMRQHTVQRSRLFDDAFSDRMPPASSCLPCGFPKSH